MKKFILVGVIIAIILIGGIIYFSYQISPPTRPLSIPCHDMPEFVGELENYFENVKINNDSCYPGFSFETPVPYSSFGMRYKVTTFDLRGAKNIEEYNSQVKERIKKVEACPDTKTYINLSDKSPIPINYLLEEYPRFDSCKSMSGIIEMMENQKIIRDFLNSQGKFGDYNSCVWGETGSGNTQALSYSGGKKYSRMTFYVFCDGKKEEILLILNNDGNVKEAYLQNSETESYRQIFPQDKILLERKPKWE